MLNALVLGLLLCAPPVAPPGPLLHEPADPAMTAKAPAAPGYGVQLTATTGKFLFTNLYVNPNTRQLNAKLYRILGNAGLGPYRLGLKLSYHAPEPEKNVYNSDPIFFGSFFMNWGALEGSPAKAAKLGSSPYNCYPIESVDGSNFGWDLPTLEYHISTSPEVAVNTFTMPFFGRVARKTYRIRTHKEETPVDPGDCKLVLSQGPPEVEAWIHESQTWQDLQILRGRQAAFAPLVMELDGRKLWLVRGLQDPVSQGLGAIRRAVEFWKEDPGTGCATHNLVDLWPEPEEGLAPGMALRVDNHWYRLQTLTLDPGDGHPTALALQPWTADIPKLLAGGSQARDMGTLKTPGLREGFEQECNDALLEWKTRTMPRWLAAQGQVPAEDLVVRIEKGLLGLDLEVKGIRTRLDAQVRAEADQKAQAALAAKEARTPPQTLPPALESERLADLLEQRKAVLMAILGNAKQTLALLRR